MPVSLLGVTFDAAEVAAERALILDLACAGLRARCPLRPCLGEHVDSPAVIVLGGAAPDFQFAADGRLRPVVAAANVLLGAGQDPYGVLAWWLGDWTEAAEPSPASLLGGPDEAAILAAAGRLLWGD